VLCKCHFEQPGDLIFQDLPGFANVGSFAQFQVQGCDILVVDPARDDMIEVTGIYVHIEGEAVHSHPATTPNAQCADFASPGRVVRIDPDTGKVGYASRINTVFVKRKDNRFFQCTQVAVDIGKEMVQVKDGIADDLPGPVIGDIPAAIYLVKRSVYSGQRFFVQQQMIHFAALAKGK